MLTSLSIHNIVLIDKITINFAGGLCGLTGETGAGKSILLDSFGLALGMRADAGLVRRGQDKAQVSAVFDVPPSHASFETLRAADMDVADDEGVILRRSLGADGRSKAYINDTPVSAALMREVGQTLVEIHGQFDTQGLLNAATHRSMLDRYAQIDGSAIKTAWDALRTARDKLKQMQELSTNAREEEAYLRESLEDLDVLSPQKDEETTLSSLRERLMHKEQVMEALNHAYTFLNEDNDPVRSAWGALDRVASKVGDDPDFNAAISALERSSNEAEEARALLQNLSVSMMESEHDLASIDERLHQLRAQARKHQCSVDDLQEKRDELAERLNLIENSDEALAAQVQKAEKAMQAYLDEAEAAHDKRIIAAEKLDALVMNELAPLKLEKARFVSHIEEMDEADWSASGFSRVQFLVSTNPGSAPAAINKVASGGEMSRFMLALKVAMAGSGGPDVMVFDEVDAGIGGATADAVGDRLHRLTQGAGGSKARQVMVVTHSPQVAAKSDAQWIVRKDEVEANQVQTNILPLETTEERCEEIARMLAGAEITNEARAAARRLLDNAHAKTTTHKSAA